MPEWMRRGQLDLWEQHVQDALTGQDRGGLPVRLLDEVFEFGRYNLYTAFNAKETTQEFTRVATLLSQSGVAIQGSQSVTAW